jgi:Small protein A (tmRNA-binding)
MSIGVGCVALLLSSCSNPQVAPRVSPGTIRSIKVGMTEQQVTTILGQPLRTRPWGQGSVIYDYAIPGLVLSSPSLWISFMHGSVETVHAKRHPLVADDYAIFEARADRPTFESPDFRSTFRSNAYAADQDAQKIPRCPVFRVSAPTVIAFFDYQGGRKIPESDDALDDFQFSWQGVRSLVEPAAIRLHECYQRSFEVEVRGRRHRVDATGIGYYLVAPGKDPRIERGVATDDDLIDIMKDYFGPQVVDKARAKPR